MEMNRRGLLGAIGAALAALLPWKKKAPEPRPIPDEVREGTRTNVWQAWEEVQDYAAAHPGCRVLSSDYPHLLLIGYAVIVNGKPNFWRGTRLSALRDPSLAEGRGTLWIKELLKTSEGRGSLAQLLKKGRLRHSMWA